MSFMCCLVISKHIKFPSFPQKAEVSIYVNTSDKTELFSVMFKVSL